MNKQTRLPQQIRGEKKTFPLDEVNRLKLEKAQVEGIVGRPKDERYKRHTRTP